MDAAPPQDAHVRWLVAGRFLPSPSGVPRPLSPEAFAEVLARATARVSVTTPDRIGSQGTSRYTLCLDSPGAFEWGAVVEAVPELRDLRALREALSRAGDAPVQQLAAGAASFLGPGRLASSVAEALLGPRTPPEARRAALALVDEALFSTASDILQHPQVARLESSWRGLRWLLEHCPADSGMRVEVLDTGGAPLLDTLRACLLEAAPLQRPDALFLLDECEDVDTLRALASLGEEAQLPVVVGVPHALLGHAPPSRPEEARLKEAWGRLRAHEASRWLCATLNPVVMASERHGALHRACFTSPTLAVAALLAASFRASRTFGRLVGPGSGTRAPSLWQMPDTGSKQATQVPLSLNEQQLLAARGLLGVGGWEDSPAVLLAAAPTVYGGRDAAPLSAQLLTGRVLRLAQALAERLPPGARNDEVARLFSRAAEAYLFAGPAQGCRLEGRLGTAPGAPRALHVRASLQPAFAGSYLQLEFSLPLRS